MKIDEGAGPVHRLMGVSACRMQGSIVEKLLAMRADICRFNARRAVRTAIWYSSGSFLQWYEGPCAAVEEAWQRSQAHHGNDGHKLIHRSDGNPALVAGVHLSTAHNRETPDDVARRIHHLERQHELHWQAEPLEIWQQLSAPCLAREVDAMAAIARGNVVAVTSEFTESVELVRALAEHQHADVTYQRFADDDLRSGDTGAAYVDVARGSHMTRVQALSRRALGNAMVRISLQQMQSLVLLLGDRPDAAVRLATAVLPLLAGMEFLPAVRLVGPSPTACQQAAHALAALPGLDIAASKAGRSGRHWVSAVLDVIGELQPTPMVSCEPVSSPLS